MRSKILIPADLSKFKYVKKRMKPILDYIKNTYASVSTNLLIVLIALNASSIFPIDR